MPLIQTFAVASARGYGFAKSSSGAAATSVDYLLVSGGGGGGSGGYGPITTGGNGGSGIVIIRYLNTFRDAVTTGSPTFTNSGGYKIYQFTGSGSISF